MTVGNVDHPALAQGARTSLGTFIGLVTKTDNGKPAIPPPHLSRVIAALEDDTLGHTLIVLPPGGAKTNTMIAAHAWWLGQDPTAHHAYICNTGPRAQERSVAIRDIVERGPVYRQLFPNVKPAKDKGWGEGAWFLQRPNLGDKDPTMLAIGQQGAILGARLRRVTLDDIADDDNMATELQRAKLTRWIEKTLLTRMMRPSGDKPGGRIVMICTRWHDEDPAAWALKQGWHYVHVPAIDDEGNSYWPELWPIEALACKNDIHPEGRCWFNGSEWENCKKRELGSTGFAQQYMGVAVDEGAGIFKRAWLGRRYRELPGDARQVGAITIDTAGWDEKSTDSDEAVVLAGYTDGVRIYVDAMVGGRMSFPEVQRAAQDMRAAHANSPIVVEDVPWAKPLIQTLSGELWGVIGWKVEGRSKENRAKAVAPAVEAGNILFREGMPGLGDLIDQLVRFPFAAHDDMVDAFVMLIMYLRGMKPSTGTKQAPAYSRYGGTVTR